MIVATLGAGPDPRRIAFRSDAPLTEFDALIVDLDAIAGEFADDVEDIGPPPLLTVAGSNALLEATRRWRGRLARFMREERMVMVGWRHLPHVRIHTMQDIMMFGPADLFPSLGLQFHDLPGPIATRATSGEPFGRFYSLLGAPIVASAVIASLRGVAVLEGPQGEVAGLYVHCAPGHMVLTSLPPEAAPLDAVRALGTALGGTRYSSFLPTWSDRLFLSGEREVVQELAALDDAIAAQELRAAVLRERLLALRRMKAVVAGTPAQAAAVAAERARSVGAVLLRDFVDEAAIVIAADAHAPVLLAFARTEETAVSIATRVESLARRFRNEFDDTPVAIAVLQADSEHGNAEESIDALRRAHCRAICARSLLDLLAATPVDLHRIGRTLRTA